MSKLLDPWDDASVLAELLAQPQTNLFVVIGAEGWCAKCRELRPHFNQMVASAANDDVWLWLDLEDHADFIGDYLPDDLPMLVSYRGSQFLSCLHIHAPLDVMVSDARTSNAFDPGIRARLLEQDWAG